MDPVASSRLSRVALHLAPGQLQVSRGGDQGRWPRIVVCAYPVPVLLPALRVQAPACLLRRAAGSWWRSRWRAGLAGALWRCWALRAASASPSPCCSSCECRLRQPCQPSLAVVPRCSPAVAAG